MTENSVDPDELTGLPPAGEADPDEYVSGDQSAVSDETGTVYNPFAGEAETTPHDVELISGDDSDEPGEEGV